MNLNLFFGLSVGTVIKGLLITIFSYFVYKIIKIFSKIDLF